MVDHNKILPDSAGQMGDRLMKSHCVKVTLFLVREQSLHVLERAGDPRLAVSLEDRDIDQKIKPVSTVAEQEVHPSAVFFVPRILLCIDQRDPIPF